MEFFRYFIIVCTCLSIVACAATSREEQLIVFKRKATKLPARCDDAFSQEQNKKFKISKPFSVRYPLQAQRDGIEGYVKLEFDLTAQGVPASMQIIESYPVKIFDRESLKTLSKMRYEVESGQTSEQRKCLTVQFEYFLDQNEPSEIEKLIGRK